MRNLRMKASLVAGLAIALLIVPVTGIGADGDRDDSFRARMDGYQEVPSLSTTGRGEFTATIDDDAQEIDFRLTFQGLEADAIVAHIHLGQRATTGGVIAFLCGGGGKPACPLAGGTVTGTIAASDVIGPVSQGIGAGEFAETVRAIRSGNVYANVHSTLRPSGEIRGQLRDDRD